MGLPLRMIHPPCLLGCDVRPGSWDLVIADLPINPLTNLRIVRPVFIGKVADEMQGLWVARQYRASFGCIDTRPETTLAKRFQEKAEMFGIEIWRAQYNTVLGGNVEITQNDGEKLVTLDRTLTLDNVLHGFQVGQSVVLPQNYKEITEGQFSREMTSSSRILERNNGRDVYKWVNQGADHALHAWNLLLIALKLSGMANWGAESLPEPGIVESSLDRMSDEPQSLIERIEEETADDFLYLEA